jgi:hypothetical protein
VYASLEGHFGSLKSSFTNLESTVQQAEHDSAYAWVKIAAEAAFFVNRELKRLPLLQKALSIAQDAGMSARIDQIKERVDEAQKNINDGLTRYGSAFEQLEKTRSDVANMEFENYSNFLKRHGAGDQVQVNLLVKTHYKEYLSTRRLNLDKWKVDLGRF